MSSCRRLPSNLCLLAVLELQRTVGRADLEQLAVHFLASLHVADGFFLRDPVERRLGDVDAALLHQFPEMAENKGQQQRADVAAVDVGIGHQDEFAVAAFGDVFELGPGRHADRLEDVEDFLVVEHLDELGLFDVEDFAPQRQDGLDVGVAARVGRAAGRIAFDQIQLGERKFAAAAVAELFRQAARGELALAADHFAGFFGGLAGFGGAKALGGDQLGDRGFSSKNLLSPSLTTEVTMPSTSLLPSLVLVCPSNCGSGRRTRDDGRQSFAEIVALRDVILEEV